jgi:capsular polysaccharide biosynthesis protein
MKDHQQTNRDDLRMKADDFDRIMRGALGVAAPPVEPKPKARPKKRPAAKKASKKA